MDRADRQGTRSGTGRRTDRGARGGLGRLGPQRRILRRLPHPWPPQRPGTLAGRDQEAGRAGRAEPRRHRGGRRPLLHRLRIRAHRRNRCRHRTASAGRAAGMAPGSREARLHRSGIPRPGGTARGSRLTDLPRRTLGPARSRHAAPRQAGLGPQAGLPRSGGTGVRAHPGPRTGQDRHRDGGPHAVREGPRPPGRTRHQHLPVAGQASAPVHRPGLRLRADDRAAHRRPARLHRLEEPAGTGRQRQSVPLLPAVRGQPDPVGRLRRDLSVRRPARARISTSGRRRSSSSPVSSSTASRSWQGYVSVTPGAVRSTPVPASPPSSVRPTRGGSPTPPDSPDSASEPPGSAPM